MPERLLDLELHEDHVRPRYLTSRGHLWVQALIDRLVACVGEPRGQVEQRLAARPRLGESPRAWQALVHLALGLHGFQTRAALPPRRLRQRLFERAAAAPHLPRAELVAGVAGELGVAPARLEQELYADLPAEQRLAPPAQPLRVETLIERYNLAQAQGLLLRAEELAVSADGQLKALLRFARLQRLLCLAEAAPGGGARLLLSGPLALFHHTTRYGRAMAAWLPAVVRAPRWRLEAVCRLDPAASGRRLRWSASFADPIGSTHAPPRRFDSLLEERFFADLQRAAPAWQVLREATPVQLGGGRIVCPDFTLVEPTRRIRVPVELVGFWTPEYLRAKWETVRALPGDVRWLLCVDEALADRGPRPPAEAPVFRFRGRIEVEPFLRFVTRWLRAAGGPGGV